VICIAFAITTFLIVRVVPIFGEIFKDFGAKLPAPTQFLIDVSDFVRASGIFSYSESVRTIFGIRAFLSSKAGQRNSPTLEIELRCSARSRTRFACRASRAPFAQLIRSGVPILEVLEIVGGTSGNHVVEESIKAWLQIVEKGDNLSVAMSKESIFPPCFSEWFGR